MSAVPQPNNLGSVRNYTLLDEIGRGAHGTVYRAQGRGSTEIMALKVIEDNSSIDRLLVEPQLLSKLNHPNIVALRDYFVHGGKVVLVMEYVDGPDLGAFAAQRGRFSCAEVRDFLEQLASAMAAAHSAGIFHSDLKPQNILVDLSGEAPRYVVVDFGVSRLAGGVHLAKYLAGTCSYMAPEQLRGRGTRQSDLWAVGTLAYLLLTGTLPFPARTMVDLRREILYKEPPLPPTVAREDAVLERSIVHLLEKSTTDRTQSADELMAELSGDAGHGIAANGLPEATGEPPQWETLLQRDVGKHKRRIVIWAVLSSLPEVVPGLLSCLGAWLIYRGQTRRRDSLTLLGFAVVIVAFATAVGIGAILGAIFGPDFAGAFSVISMLFGLFALGAASNFVRLRRAQRELTLLQTLRLNDRDEVLTVLQQYVTAAPGDMNIRRRYIEALMASDRVAEAAVEARLVLEIDPYSLPTSLLLANAYLELGLFQRCEQVCNGYLEVASQCFEFEDLLATVASRRAAV